MNQCDLVSDLRNLGLRSGDAVLTHSSYKSIGPVEGGPKAVVRALIEAVSPEGHALFPTHTWEGTGPDRLNVFDVRNTPSKAIGIIPETARTTPGGVRSLHPTHSVVVFGPRARWFAAGHEDCPTQTGVGSPYDKLADEHGYILLLGVDHERNTSIHGVEERLDVPGAVQPEVGEALLLNELGQEITKHARYHTWKARRFMKLDPLLDEIGAQRHGFVGQAKCRLVEALALRELVATVLERDPGFFWQ